MAAPHHGRTPDRHGGIPRGRRGTASSSAVLDRVERHRPAAVRAGPG
ncbi:hypothetical protein [Gulosibacter sp. 10]|nr:hypothetical protein [Gulosibacter sp. 10]SJM59322.1 hypothetical protein FM112_06405 [Gulosibacter sp. 10]